MANRPTPLTASGRDYVLLLLLSAMWGGSFLLIKLAVATLPPLWVASLRITVGGLALLLVLRLRGLVLPRGRAVWARLAFMGIVGNLAPFALIGWGELQVASGLAAILMAMVPLMVMVIAHFRVPDEPLTPGKTLGVGLGILGVILLIGPSALSGRRQPCGGGAGDPRRHRLLCRLGARGPRPAAAARRCDERRHAPRRSTRRPHRRRHGRFAGEPRAQPGIIAGRHPAGPVLHRPRLCAVLPHPDAAPGRGSPR